MSTSAVILMIIGCVGLWGGFGVASGIAIHCAKKDKTPTNQQDTGDNK